ncbi:ABC transporter permease [Acanthopleuribacter pedis]|uniref:Iron ABC transporter permease n=1 Tax=Acanthopleuribacter pedis TaxID=442870 RepID=A0A8J7QI88_9BACT|nr:iron ABC transporter permease [Acanthopleuribacter pedis]MBO1322890.1 iron ABC transporter permease [Acanthopleuribacter pedis]
MHINRILDRWSFGLILLGIAVVTPIAVVLSALLFPPDEHWSHMLGHDMGRLLANTFGILAGVLFFTTVLGVGLAWLVAACDFPGRRFFRWAMILPFAFPTYVLGYVWIDILDLAGPVQQSYLRLFGERPTWLPNPQSVWGLVFVMSLAFYPYVFMLARGAFEQQGQRAMEVARILGRTPRQAFFSVLLPMARPWITAGLLLVAMETLADFGTVATFNVDTFTTAIYKAWFGFFSLNTAARLAAMLVFFTLILLFIEKWTQRRKRFYQVAVSDQAMRRFVLPTATGWAVFALFAAVLALGFVIPMIHLAYWVFETFGEEFDGRYWVWLRNTMGLGISAAALLGLLACFAAYAQRLNPRPWVRFLVALCTMGYALPGTVLAVGVYIPLVWLDDQLYEVITAWTSWEPRVLINGTVAIILYGYAVRFMAVSFQPVEAAMQRIRPAMDEAARGLGASRLRILHRIHLPLLRGGVLSGCLIVLVDVMKEMPITLMTRPLGWDTLAVRIFELTSEGHYERAALPSMMLVLAGLLPVLFLMFVAPKNAAEE